LIVCRGFQADRFIAQRDLRWCQLEGGP
jgi:hypothetical protein